MTRCPMKQSPGSFPAAGSKRPAAGKFRILQEGQGEGGALAAVSVTVFSPIPFILRARPDYRRASLSPLTSGMNDDS